MQHLHLAAAAGNEELKKREEATAKAIDELEDSYSEDEYVRDRKIEKPQSLQSSGLWGKKKKPAKPSSASRINW